MNARTNVKQKGPFRTIMGGMERATDPFALLTRGVQTVSLHRIAALAKLGLLPELPISVRDLNLHGRERDPGRQELIPLEWVIAGDPYKPGAVMALRSRYDYAYGGDVLEIVHVAGRKHGVLRLVLYAKELGRIYGCPVSGEIDIQNDTMWKAARKAGFRPERVRLTFATPVAP